tara:strand:+ start:15285 stop:17303 length:2019 start_codon:yes stop_codon:yes gene_type:complete
MSSQNVRVGVIFSASLRGFSQFKKLGGGMIGLQGAVKKVRAELTLLAATMAFDFMKNAVMTFAQFDHSMRKVQAVTGGTVDQLKELTAEARRLGREFPFTASESADAMFELSLAGLEVNEVMATTETTLKLAMAGNMGLAQSARIAVATMNAFGYEAEDITEIGDRLTAAFTNSAMTLAEVGAGLSFVGPVAALANVSLEDSVTVLGLFANAGIAGARSGTTFRQMLSKMIDPTTDAARRMQELGLQFTNAQGELLPMIDIVQQLIDAQMTANDVTTIFGIRAAPGVGAIIQQGVEGFEELSEAINDSDGELNQVASTMEQSAHIEFKKFTSAMDDFKIVLGGAIMPIINEFIDAFRGEGGLGESLSSLTVALIPFFGALGEVARILLQILVVLAPVAEFLAEHSEIVSALVQAYILLAIAKKVDIILTMAQTAKDAIYTMGKQKLVAWTWASIRAMGTVAIVGAALLSVQQGNIEMWQAIIVLLIMYTFYQYGSTIATYALVTAKAIWAAATWGVNAALVVMNVLMSPITLIILAIVAAVAAVIAIFIFWEEILYGIGVAIEYVIEALAKLVNTMTFGLTDFGGAGTLFDGWGNIDIFHKGGMSHGGLAMLAAGETVKPAAAVSEEERQGYNNRGGTFNNTINVTTQRADSAFAGDLARKLARMQRLELNR